MIQIKIPVDIEKSIEITDPIYSFNEVMDQIEPRKYYHASKSNLGRPKYDCEKMLNVALFGFMDNGYASLRNIEKLCKTDIRYIWFLDGEKAPTYATISNHLREYIGENIETLFADINHFLFERDGVDLSRVYIDGTKIEANANKYTWVWKNLALKTETRFL